MNFWETFFSNKENLPGPSTRTSVLWSCFPDVSTLSWVQPALPATSTVCKLPRYSIASSWMEQARNQNVKCFKKHEVSYLDNLSG